MRHKPDKMLLEELQAAGAGAAEARELQGIALQLGRLKPAQEKPRKCGWKLAVPLGFTAGMATMLAVIILARGAMPGSPLYSVQRASDSVAIAMHPSYRATVMMHQAEQVKMLVENQAPSTDVMTALNDYQQQAKTYRTHYADYEVFERCKDSLRQAASHATGTDRQAIDATLAGLQDV